jgi:hypothetical protein
MRATISIYRPNAKARRNGRVANAKLSQSEGLTAEEISCSI